MMQRRYSGQHWALLPFVIGIIVGVSVSTVILVRPYTEHITTNVYILGSESNAAGLEPHSLELEERLRKYEKLMEELYPTNHRGTGPRWLAEEAKMKDPVHYSVILSESSPTDMVDILRNTWTRDIPQPNIDYYFPPTSEPSNVDTISNAVRLSADGLFEIQVLKHVCTEKINSTKWYFIGYDTAYVKTLELEAYLLTLEAIQDQLPYMGKPVKRDPLGRLCLPGPGSLLSSQTLSRLCGRVSNCVNVKEELETDCALGECVSKQLPGVQCNKDLNRPQSLFVRFDSTKKGPIIDPKNKNTLRRAFTIYPVADPKLMYNIHQLVVGSRLNASQHFAQELKQTVDQMTSFLPHSKYAYALSTVDVVKSREDVAAWQLINHNRLMEWDSENPSRKLPGFWKSELDSLTSTIMGYLTSLHDDQQLVFSRVVNAYWRLHPLTGMQYIIDFEAKSEVAKGDQAAAAAALIHFSARLSRVYSPPELSPVQPQVKGSKSVTIAIVMTAGQESELQAFMKALEKVLNKDQRLDLIVVKMRTEMDRKTSKKSDSSLETILHFYETRYLRASFKLVSSPYMLSRAHGLALVLHEVKPTDILFLSDLYLSFNASFVDRCRNIPLQGQQVYYPIPFAVGNGTSNNFMSQSGHWLVKSHSVACLYAADVLFSTQQAGGKGIPTEVDMEQLYQGLLGKEYEVVRSVDSGLWKRGPKNSACELDLVGEEQEPCRTVHKCSFGNLQLRTQLSQMLFDHEGRHSEKKF